MSEGVVDGLEVVEVEEAHHERPRFAAVESVLRPLEEQRPVGQPGEGVVQGAVAQLVLEPTPVGDIAGVEDQGVHGGLVEQVGDRRLGVAERAVRVLEAALDPDLVVDGGARSAPR